MLEILATSELVEAQISVARHVIGIMTGIEVYPCETMPRNAGEAIHGVLHYLGESGGSLILECSPGVAFAFTQRLMDIPAPQAFDQDVQDSVGELVNMIGGNLKGLLPPETEISVPLVTSMHLSEDPSSIGRRLSCLEFTCEFGWWRLILHEK